MKPTIKSAIHPPCVWSLYLDLELCAITPDAHDLHGKGQSRKSRLDPLGELLFLYRLPYLLAIYLITLGLQLGCLSLLLPAFPPAHGIVNA